MSKFRKAYNFVMLDNFQSVFVTVYHQHFGVFDSRRLHQPSLGTKCKAKAAAP
jgi:hypothetical protein